MISIARGLVAQRQSLSALSGITFSFDPQVATLDVYPRSLITVTTQKTPLRAFAVVPFVATEQLAISASDGDASEFESTVKLLKHAVRNQIYFTKECRIHGQDFASEVLSFDEANNVRIATLTWVGFASWEDV